MGILDKMKASVGIGGTKIKIVLDNEDADYGQGDNITGKVEVTGGNTEQTIDELTIELVCKWIESGDIEQVEYADGSVDIYEDGDEKLKDVLADIVLEKSIHVIEGYQNYFEFDFEVPWGADLTIEKEMEYYLYARADIPGAIDAKDKIIIEIEPSCEIEAVEDVLEDIFDFEFEDEYSDQGSVIVEFLAPQNFPTDRMALMMRNEEEGLEVEMFLDLEDMDLKDYMQSSVGRDVQKYKIFMPYAQINPDDDEPDLDKIADIFKEVFADLKWT